jgi:hypothetical protein
MTTYVEKHLLNKSYIYILFCIFTQSICVKKYFKFPEFPEGEGEGEIEESLIPPSFKNTQQKKKEKSL